MNKIEILAPSGDKESLIAALNANADAIYLGLANFNARAKAANFSSENLLDTVRLIHLYGSKVYVTVNTILKDEEYGELINLVKEAVKAKVDAFIIQDLGVARILSKCFPGIILHASTQMGINNLNGALFAESLGIKRVILARETRLDDIKEIKENTSLEIEYFIQGALCVSYSGNCYMSSLLSGNSGNRGKCLQLCRLSYNYKGDEKYYLSARDLCLIKELKTLIDAGVTSFKIEGRLRHPGYVATSVKTYKKALDALANNKKFNYNLAINELKESFNRGEYLYNAYLENDTPDYAISKDYNNHIGVKIGKLISCSIFKDIHELTLFSEHKLVSGDGLKFFLNNKEVGSIGVGNVIELGNNIYKIYSKRKIPNGSNVNLILNKAREDSVLNNHKLMSLDVFIEAKINKPLLIEFNYQGIKARITSEFILPRAKNAPITEANLLDQVNKFDTNPFKLGKSKVLLDNVFIPKSIINETRRKAIELIKQEIIDSNEIDNKVSIDEDAIASLYNETKASFKYNKKIIIVEDSKDIVNLENKDDYLFVIYKSILNYESIVNAIEDLLSLGIKNIGLYQYLIMQHKDQLILESLLAKYPFVILYGNNVSCLSFINKGYKVIASNNLNIYSSFAINTFKELGVTNVVASLEFNKEFLDKHSDIYAYSVGIPTLMNFAHCPYKTTAKTIGSKCLCTNDLKYNDYKVRRYKASACYFELLHDKTINTYNDLINNKVIDLRSFDNQEKNNIIEALNNKLEMHVNLSEYQGLLYKEVK